MVIMKSLPQRVNARISANPLSVTITSGTTLGNNLVRVSHKKGQPLLFKSKNWLFVKLFSTVEWAPTLSAELYLITDRDRPASAGRFVFVSKNLSAN
jgi:hypothetical protein